MGRNVEGNRGWAEGLLDAFLEGAAFGFERLFVIYDVKGWVVGGGR